jgi:lysophospholipase L1-like esterase
VHFAPIEDPSGRALQAFHAALRDLKQDPGEDKKVRVAFYGASSVAADRYTGYLRGYLQQRFGDGGVGFVTLVPLWRWHRHDAVRLDASKHWRIEHGQRKEGKLDGFYGLLGASAHTTKKNARSTLHAKGSAVSKITDSDTFALQYLEQPGGGTLSLSFPKPAAPHTIATAGARTQLQTAEVPLPDTFTPMTLRASGDGEVRVMGGIFERDQPGVVVDALGIGGTRSANLVNWDVPSWTAALRARAPALYVLAYGANESVDEDEPIEVYRENLEAVLDRFAAAVPDASCVLVGPVDYPLKDEETEAWGVRPRLRQILETQREVAAARGCGFFDTARLTGGLDSMPAWVAADPKLAKDDHLHLTPLGYLHFGRVLSDALMADFDGEPRVQDP